MNAIQIPTNFPIPSSSLSSKSCSLVFRLPQKRKLGCYLRNECKMSFSGDTWRSLGEKGSKELGFLMRRGMKERVVVVRSFGFNGGEEDKSKTSRVLGNLVLAVGFTYLTMTGQLGWILDAIVSIWLLAVLLPIVGLGAFLWFAGRNIVQSSCPNCGNNVPSLKSSLKDSLQLCPFCAQPFSVQGDKFVNESDTSSSFGSTAYGQIFNGFSPRSDKGKVPSGAVVDIEAEVKDID